MIRKMTGAWLALTLLPMSAQAGGHYICFQDYDRLNPMVGVYACRAEPGGQCEVVRPNYATYRSPPFSTPISTWETQVSFPATGTYTGTIKFWRPGNLTGTPDAVHTCDVVVQSSTQGYATPGATLEGYTTDGSGKLTTGVWKKNSGYASGREPRKNVQTIQTPWDFVAVGGGVVGAEWPSGALVYKSAAAHDLDEREWSVGTQDDDIDIQPHNNDAYVIGMKIEGVGVRTLRTLVLRASAESPQQAHPSAAVWLPSGFELLSGGIDAYTRDESWGMSTGQFATSMAPPRCSPLPCVYDPALHRGWHAASKDHRISRPGFVAVSLSGLSTGVSIGGVAYWVQSKIFAAQSARQSHPTAVVAGQMGEYALTGVGAHVNWADYSGSAGNLLWKVKPRPDIAGAEVASKDHGIYSPAKITAYAIGVRLIEAPVFLPVFN